MDKSVIIGSAEIVEQQISVDVSSVVDGQEAIAEQGKTLQVVDAPSNQIAANLISDIKSRLLRLDGIFAPFESVAVATKKRAEAMRAGVVGAKEIVAADLKAADRLIMAKMTAYYTEEKARQAELARKAQKEAEERLLAAAVKAAESGASAAAEAIISTPVVPMATVAPKAQGVVMQTVWLYRATADRLDPAYETLDEYGFRVPDHRKIRSAVTAGKGSTSITGVEVYSETRGVRR